MIESRSKHWKLRQQLELYRSEKMQEQRLMESIIGLSGELSMIRSELDRTVDHALRDRLHMKYGQGQRQLHDLALRHADAQVHVNTRRITARALCGDFLRSGCTWDDLDALLAEFDFTAENLGL